MQVDVNKIQILMAQNEMSATDLAKKGGFSASTLYQHMNGSTKNMSGKIVGKIANALNVDITEILMKGGKDEGSSRSR